MAVMPSFPSLFDDYKKGGPKLDDTFGHTNSIFTNKPEPIPQLLNTSMFEMDKEQGKTVLLIHEDDMDKCFADREWLMGFLLRSENTGDTEHMQYQFECGYGKTTARVYMPSEPTLADKLKIYVMLGNTGYDYLERSR